MSISNNNILPYNPKLLPDDRKHKMLVDTFNQLDLIRNNLHDLIIALYGALEYDNIKQFASKEKPHISADALCSINWFRLVKTNERKPAIESNQIISKFIQYSGHTPDKYALSHITGNHEPSHKWIDCREYAINYARIMHLSFSQFQDLATACLNCKILILNGTLTSSWAWGANSALFGGSDKENFSVKAKILNSFIENLKDEMNTTKFQVVEKVCQQIGSSDAADLFDLYRSTVKDGNRGPATGRNPKVMNLFSQDGEISSEQREDFIESFQKVMQEKNSKQIIPHLDELKYHLVKQSGLYDIYSWAAAIKNANSTIVASNSSNLNTILNKTEKQQTFEELRKDEKIVACSKILLSVNDTLPEDLHYNPSTSNLGKNLDVFFDLLNENSVHTIENKEEKNKIVKECVNQYMEECKGLNKPPMPVLLTFISDYAHKHQAQDFLSAAKMNFIDLKIKSIKVVPTVHGSSPYTWISNLSKKNKDGKMIRTPNSSLIGWIIPPEEIHDQKFAGQNPIIWAVLRVYCNNKWEMHHFPFSDSRFFTEVYAYKPNLPYLPGGENRSKRFGYRHSTNLSNESRQILLDKSKYAKANKSVLRCMENMTHNVVFDPKTSLNIRIKTDKNNSPVLDDKGRITFVMQINHRILEKYNNTKVEIGDRILAYDQNQSENHTYAILQRTEEGSHAHQFNGWYVRVLETGKVTSIVQGLSGPIDQLNYDGMPVTSHKFNCWQADRSAFVSQFASLKISETETFDEAYQAINAQGAYTWNLFYLRILRKALRVCHMENINQFREEILAISKNRLSPMSLGSLSQNSLKMIRAFKSIINCYMSRMSFVDELQKKEGDLELHTLMRLTDNKLNDKRVEKINRASSFLTNKAHSMGCKMIVGESDLPVADSKTSKKQNADRMDWCARALSHKVEYACKLMGLAYRGIPAYMSSHQDPLVHLVESNKSVLRPRFVVADKSDVKQHHLDNLRRMLNSKTKVGTAVYYREAVELMCEELGIHKTDMAKGKVSLSDFVDKFIGEKAIFPQRGGRFYMSTKRLTTGAKLICYSGSDVWLSDADEIAAINIGMFVVCDQTGAFKKKKKEKLDDEECDILPFRPM